MFKYLRIKLFYGLLRPFSEYTRKKRLSVFVKKAKPHRGMKILDLGGQPQIWDFVNTPMDITCLNLPGIAMVDYQTHHNITFIEGDACNMPFFKPGQFDLVFSNSVIEHVGNQVKRKQFANEIMRLSTRYWIQTPSKYFPIEAHCGMPLWWFYPKKLRLYFLRQWRLKLPSWTDMIENTTVLDKNELKELFPNSRLKVEWMIFPKSLTVFSI